MLIDVDFVYRARVWAVLLGQPTRRLSLKAKRGERFPTSLLAGSSLVRRIEMLGAMTMILVTLSLPGGVVITFTTLTLW